MLLITTVRTECYNSGCLFWESSRQNPLLKPGITHLHHLRFFSLLLGEKKINILKCCIGDIKAGCISFRAVNFTALQQIKHMGDRKSLARNLSQRMERGRPIRPAQLRQWRCDWMLLLSVTFAPRKATKGPTLSPSKQTPISGSSASRAILVCSHPCKHKSSHQQNRSLLDYL